MCDKMKDSCEVNCKKLMDGPELNLKPFLLFFLLGLLCGALSSNPYKSWAW
jgi:hypothetical protein